MSFHVDNRKNSVIITATSYYIVVTPANKTNIAVTDVMTLSSMFFVEFIFAR